MLSHGNADFAAQKHNEAISPKRRRISGPRPVVQAGSRIKRPFAEDIEVGRDHAEGIFSCAVLTALMTVRCLPSLFASALGPGAGGTKVVGHERLPALLTALRNEEITLLLRRT